MQFTSDNNRLTPYQQSEYRAILMIDGNSWPSSIVWNFLSGSVVIAVSVWHTYIFDKMTPWIDYIPCKPDLSDINQIIELVMKDNELDLQKIADNGKRKQIGWEIYLLEFISQPPQVMPLICVFTGEKGIKNIMELEN